MRELELHLDAEYYKSLTEADRETALRILKTYEGRGTRSDHPRLILTAGAMTAGKSTVFDKLVEANALDPKEILFLDPDHFKHQIPDYVRLVASSHHSAGSQFHILSMYIADMLLGWLFLQSKSAVYMTSLRHMPSGKVLIERVRRDHPQYRVGIFSVRAPISILQDRNQERFQRTGRQVPPPLLTDSVYQVEDSLWHLGPLADDLFIFSNDQDRSSRLVYRREKGRVQSLSLALESKPSPALVTEVESFVRNGSSEVLATRLIDIPMDMDWTLTYLLMADASDDFVRYRKERYRITDGLAEVVSVLTEIPGVRVSIVSGGLRERNEEVLRQIEMPDGSNLFERVFRILSSDELETVSNDTSLKFSERKKKNYQRIAADLDPRWTIAVDDQRNIAFDDTQNRSTLWLQRTFNFFEDYRAQSAELSSKVPYPPNSETAWALERYKLAWALGIILTAIDLTRSEGIDLQTAMIRLTHDSAGALLNREHLSQLPFYLKGIQAMLKVNPRFMKIPFPLCASSLAELAKNPLTLEN
jgi:hypothetical protein